MSWLNRNAYPFASRWQPLRDGRLHHVEVGEGTGSTVVLVHGTPTWSFEWRHVLEGLKADHRMIALDHLGFGLSDRPTEAGYAPEDHSRRFKEFMNAVCPEGPVSLVVHDFGGPIALDWALENPDRLSRLVVVNSWMWPFDDDPKMRRQARLASGMLGRWLYRWANASLRLLMPSAYGDRRRLTPEVHQQYLQVFPDADSRERVLFALARALLGSSAYFDRLWARRSRLMNVPLSLYWGMKDLAFPPKMLARWQEAFPEAEVRRFEGAGHWPHEEEPEAFVNALRQTLAGAGRV